MSETEQHIGKAKLIYETNIKEKFEEYCKEICLENSFEKLDHYDSYEETIRWENNDKFIIINSGSIISMYEVISKKKLEGHDDIYEADLDKEGNIKYVLKYYNGGCGFEEAFGQAIKNMNKEKV